MVIANNLTSICCVYKEKMINTTHTEFTKLHYTIQIVGRQVSQLPMFLHDSTWQRHLAGKNRSFKGIVYKRSNKYYEKLTIYKCGEK